MSKEKLSAEEKINARLKFEEGLKKAETELLDLFDSGVPLGVLDNNFEEDQHFQWVLENWKSAVDSFIQKNEVYLCSIELRKLMNEHLKTIPTTSEVYLIHCPNYEFEAWVKGNLAAAQLCLKGKVERELHLEPNCWSYTEEDIEYIKGLYEIEKVTADTLTK